MKTIHFKDSYGYLKYLYENKLITGFSRDFEGQGAHSITVNGNLNDKATIEKVEEIFEKLIDLHQYKYEQIFGESSEIVISTRDNDLSFDVANSSWIDAGDEVLECIFKVVSKELKISVDEFYSNHYIDDFSLEINPNNFDSDVFNSFKIYTNTDTNIELQPNLLKELFTELSEILIENACASSDEDKVYTIDGSSDSVSIYENFENDLDCDTLKNDKNSYSINPDIL